MAERSEQRRLHSLVYRFINEVERLNADNPRIYEEIARIFERALEKYFRRVN